MSPSTGCCRPMPGNWITFVVPKSRPVRQSTCRQRVKIVRLLRSSKNPSKHLPRVRFLLTSRHRSRRCVLGLGWGNRSTDPTERGGAGSGAGGVRFTTGGCPGVNSGGVPGSNTGGDSGPGTGRCPGFGKSLGAKVGNAPGGALGSTNGRIKGGTKGAICGTVTGAGGDVVTIISSGRGSLLGVASGAVGISTSPAGDTSGCAATRSRFAASCAALSALISSMVFCSMNGPRSLPSPTGSGNKRSPRPKRKRPNRRGPTRRTVSKGDGRAGGGG